MEMPSSAQERITHQFDALMKQVLKGEARNCKKKIAERSAHESLFSELDENQLSKFGVYDEHRSDYSNFSVYGFDIVIKNELLAEAVTGLSEQKRNIILLSYFLDLSDGEIAELLNLVRSTVTFHRETALRILRKLMEERTDDKNR